MITQLAEIVGREDPEGSIFLPEPTLIEQFLSFQDDPYELLEQIAVGKDSEALYLALDSLKFHILQCRNGVSKHPEPDDDMSEEDREALMVELVAENKLRMEYYLAVDDAQRDLRIEKLTHGLLARLQQI
jgi:hypothetical protein